uniref:Reverse transcriptase domain-containing protein n=1 Tax=Knipowitschia caucasica TaxID=637954 RepID=A0AAV2KJJ1_KNICA
MCLGAGHAALSATCASCVALPREESERRRAFFAATAPRPDSSKDEESEIDWAPLDIPPVPAEWGDCEDGEVSEVGSLLTLDEVVSNPEPDRFPLDHMPGLYATAAAIMDAPLPPQPNQRVEDFTSGYAAPRGRRRAQPTLCPRMDPIVHYATREWPKPLAAKRPALGYGMYCNVQDWSWTGGVPDIEDSVRAALHPSSSVWPSTRPLLPSERDRMSLAMHDRCYANAAQVVAVANNMAFITGALDRSLSSDQALSGDTLAQARTTSAAILRMCQALAVDGGRSMAAAQVGARHLWLGAVNLREAEKRQLLDLPISQTSLFGPEMQTLMTRLDSAAKDSASLAKHLATRREARPPARSRDRGRERSPGKRPGPYPRSVVHRSPAARPPGPDRHTGGSRDQHTHRRPPYGRGGRGGKNSFNKGRPAFHQYSLSESHLGVCNMSNDLNSVCVTSRAYNVAPPGLQPPEKGVQRAVQTTSSDSRVHVLPSRREGRRRDLISANVCAPGASVLASLSYKANTGFPNPGALPPLHEARAKGGRSSRVTRDEQSYIANTGFPNPGALPPLHEARAKGGRSSRVTRDEQSYNANTGFPDAGARPPLHEARARGGRSSSRVTCGEQSRTYDVGPAEHVTALGAHDFYDIWKEQGLLSDVWLEKTLRRGYALQFFRKPPPFRGVRAVRSQVRGSTEALEAEVSSLLSRGAAVEVDPQDATRGLYSPYFLFRMLSTRQLLECVREGDWMTSIDLTDAYFHVPIVPEHRRFLRFAVGERNYEYCRLPFGEVAVSHTQWVLSHIQRLGFVVNREKSKLQPAQRMIYLGLQLDSVIFRAALSVDRRTNITRLAREVLAGPRVPARRLRSLLGMMAAAHAVVRLGLLHMRNFQRWFSRLRLHPSRDGGRLIWVPQGAASDIRFWLTPGLLRDGVTLACAVSHAEVFTDASLEGWGGVLGQSSVGGCWSDSARHINLLEMEAVHRVLLHFAPQLQGRHVMVRSDNTTVVSYLNRQGGTRSPALHRMATVTLLWAALHLLSLRARTSRGSGTWEPTGCPGGGPLQDEWGLAPRVAAEIWRRFGRPVVDLFASAENAQCPSGSP